MSAEDPAAMADPEGGRRYSLVMRRAIALADRLEYGRLDVTMPDGRRLAFGGRYPGPNGAIVIRDETFARRLAQSGDIGLAESYLRGEWATPDLTAFLCVFCANHSVVATLLDSPVMRLLQRARHWLNSNTRAGSRRNIHAHYDLGNAFYAAWLDPTMTYSSALFEAGRDDLTGAQTRKYARLAEATSIAPDHHVLEIGCGWGGFADFAAKAIGCRVTGLTISPAQHAFASRRIFEAGLNERVSIKLTDYRDERGVYDRVASIEMLEAVGERYWPRYFAQLRDRLVPGGRAGIQVITLREDLFAAYRSEIDFVRRYIFPGGMLPTVSRLHDLGATAGLSVEDEIGFGKDYARTLDHWRTRFREAWPGLVALGFDERFRRLWEYYYAYCEVGFLTGQTDVRQMVFAKP